MKVLHVSPNVSQAFGGPTQALAGYARAAATAGATIALAAPAAEQEDRAWLSSAMPDSDVFLFASRGSGAAVHSAALQAWLRAHAARYDVVHVHGLLNPVSSLAARHCIRRGLPVVIRPFGTLSRYTFAHRRGWAKRAYFRGVDGPNLRVADVHFTTAAEHEESRWHGIDWADRAHVVPPPWIGAAAEPSVSRRGAGSGQVLFLSRLTPVKQVEALLAAWPHVHAVRPDARLTIAGDGERSYVESLRARAARLEPAVASSVRFAGFARGQAKTTLFASADAFVLPSRHENFGVAALEAMAAGVPVIVTPEVQLSSFVRQHHLGIVADRSPDLLAAALVEVLRSAELQRHCAENGPRLVAHQFSAAIIGTDLRRMYEAACARRTRHPL